MGKHKPSLFSRVVRFLAVLFLLLLSLYAYLFWNMRSRTIEYGEQEASSRIQQILEIGAVREARGIATSAWPGEHTSYFRFRRDENDSSMDKVLGSFATYQSCELEQAPKLRAPPDWFSWPDALGAPVVYSSSDFDAALWIDSVRKDYYLFRSSVRFRCFTDLQE